jgi:hypothetical protein
VAFRFRKNESISKGLRRLLEKELRSAIDQLSSEPADESIHEARKSIKKVRAILQLVGERIAAGHAATRLRRAGHLLAPLRDVDAMIETAKTFKQRSTVSAHSLRALRSELTAEKERLMTAAHDKRISARAADAVERVRRDAANWHWKRIGFQALAKAIRRSYTRARNGMRDAREQGHAMAFHEWRKQVKTFWYALRLLEGRALRLRGPVVTLKRLETELGDDHNLAVLQRQPGVGQSLRSLTERRQRKLRRIALAIGAKLFAHSPKAFSRRLHEMSKAKGAAARTLATA